jgi:AAA+ ATPase superfamily predicted ATPase
MKITHLIQRQIPIGEKATFFLKDGRMISGNLIEIGQYHIIISNNSFRETILEDIINSWNIAVNEKKPSEMIIEKHPHDILPEKFSDIPEDKIDIKPLEDFQEIVNPYFPYAEGGPVDDPAMFYGRDELLNTISKELIESSLPKSIIIYGQKRSGKSSILRHLKRKIQDNKIVVDFSMGDILLDFSVEALLWKILYGLETTIKDSIDNGVPPLSFKAPTLSDIKNNSTLLFSNKLSEFNRLRKKDKFWKERNIVLMIDEFSYIYGEIIKGNIPEVFMKSWKALFEQGHFSIILVGQDVIPKFKQKFPNEFGISQDIRVSYLKKDAAEKLIDEPIKIGGKKGKSRYREKAIERIISLTAGSPFYIQMMCNKLVVDMNNKKTIYVTDADVEQIKDDMIRGVNALTEDKFDNFISAGDDSPDAISNKDTLEVLKSIALGSRTGPCSKNNINCKTSVSIDMIIEDLLKREVIERPSDNHYRIRVELFKEWLIAHYGGR